MSYAEAIAQSPKPAEAIRNVTIKGSIEEMEQTAAKIRNDSACAKIPLKSVKQKGKFNFTFKCADGKSAEQAEKMLIER